MAEDPPPMTDSQDSGERRLKALGYKQELRRKLSLFKIVAVAFSTIGLYTGITPLYGFGLLNGGAVGVVWGWLVVCFFMSFVALAMAEICSSYPTTGSLYFWAAHLAGPAWGPFAAWLTAWLEAVGLTVSVGAQSFCAAKTVQTLILLLTGTHKHGGYLAPKPIFLAIYVALILVWACINTLSIEAIAYMDVVGVWLQVVAGAAIVAALPLVAVTRQSAAFVFGNFETHADVTGVQSPAYSLALSLLMSQFSVYGFDAAAYLTEETERADVNGPMAILLSLGSISVFGWMYILALTFSIQGDPARLFSPDNETAGAFAPAQIYYDVFQGRFGSAAGAYVILCVILLSFFFCGASILTSASRVVYAFSRDGGLPGSRYWRQIHPRLQSPVHAVWLCAFIAILVGVPVLKLDALFTAITSISTVGWVGGYAVPIFFRLIQPSSKFERGPFHLGSFSRPVCFLAFSWICYTCTVFLLPTSFPVRVANLNYAPIALSFVVAFFMVWWIMDARRWFRGPIRVEGLEPLLRTSEPG
ncbi:amino acid transporter protein [Klebsormidium nitens]|uniref:Amino acid transporter protein n=1 Tax=Klebsormidium nitens TaxID=105231 RepID=A0A1Y1HRY9_KLENI|nr:amino acid transporter protein [Klebsormidium nitens]|eukprot:GAQ80863.1 amino acid transporter protein [Klebsormidium nitens]